jgi:catechol 2,3-dioxygenase-like lactoylglutathione lyase family enzyme
VLTAAPIVAFVATTDLARSHAFYGEVLGLNHVEATPFANVYEAAGTTLRVTLVDRVAAARYTVLGWAVPDIAGAMEDLARRGVAFARYDGLDQDAAGVWTAPSQSRRAASHTRRAAPARRDRLPLRRGRRRGVTASPCAGGAGEA